MKLHYDRETDSLYIRSQRPPERELSRDPGTVSVIDFDAEGKVVGIDIQHASQVMDLAILETESLPAATLRLT